MHAGLISATFRKLSARDIVGLASEAELHGIAWSGDSHVPHGNIEIAREVGRMTRDAGLHVEGFASYHLHPSANPAPTFESIVETAVALGAPRIRVWAGSKGSAETSPEEREAIRDNLQQCARLAAAANLALALEFHSHSLTDTIESTVSLLSELDNAVRLYWQPPLSISTEDALAGLNHVRPWVDSVHVFQWHVENGQIIRHPLAEGGGPWKQYLQALRSGKKDRWALLEFVMNDDPAQFLADASVLRNWLADLSSL